MEAERSFATRTSKVVGFGLLAFAITTLAGGIWSALLVTNLRSSPAVPWCVPAMALLLWLMWSYLGGRGWPRSTSEARRLYLRANRRSSRTYLWAWVAGVLSVVALAGARNLSNNRGNWTDGNPCPPSLLSLRPGGH